MNLKLFIHSNNKKDFLDYCGANDNIILLDMIVIVYLCDL